MKGILRKLYWETHSLLIYHLFLCCLISLEYFSAMKCVFVFYYKCHISYVWIPFLSILIANKYLWFVSFSIFTGKTNINLFILVFLQDRVFWLNKLSIIRRRDIKHYWENSSFVRTVSLQIMALCFNSATMITKYWYIRFQLNEFISNTAKLLIYKNLNIYFIDSFSQ